MKSFSGHLIEHVMGRQRFGARGAGGMGLTVCRSRGVVAGARVLER